MNYAIENGGMVFDEEKKKYRIDFDKIKECVKSLSTIILLLQAEGDKKKAKEMMDKYAVANGNVAESLKLIETNQIPVDIKLIFPSFDSI